MPADTRSTRKAKHDDAGRPKVKCQSEEGSENATGSKSSIRETSSKKHDSSSPSSRRKSVRLNSRNYQSPNPSPLRRSERAKSTPNSDKSEKSSSLTEATHKSHNRKLSVNELAIVANQVDEWGKLESNTSSQRKKTLPAHRYRDLFRAHTTKVKASDSANGRAGPCTSSNSGGNGKKILAEEDNLNQEGKHGEDYAESTSKCDQGGLESSLKEVASEAPKGQNKVEPYLGQKSLNASVEVSLTCSKRQRVDGHLPEKFCSGNANLLQDTCENSIQEVHGDGETLADMDVSQNGDLSIEEDLHVDAQTDCEDNICIICKLAGRLLCCGGKGCRRRCHPACLNSLWEDVYPGVWLCPWCTKNKIESGVHSVSEGIESIWDVRVENTHKCEGVKRQKEYFAKYKGLAHAHNCWLPEQQLLLEAPELVAEFARRKTAIPWRQEWSEPHRLLQKRSLMLPKSDGCVVQEASTISFQHEWLVKWRGLDYSEITWELENSVFFGTPKALDLMNEYERRHEKARSAPRLQEVDEIQEREKDLSVKLSTLPSVCDTNCTNFINNLCDHWSKGQNVLIIDEQVQAAHIIYFILTLQSNVSRPFLVIVPSSSLSRWEAEFTFVAPSVNTIIYNGNRDARKMIRTLEFYEDGPRVMFEVLLSTLDIITEDLEFIKCFRWEAVIMDECHKSETLAESVCVKELASGSMILLLMDQISDNATDYCNILSLLERNHDSSDVEGRQVDSDSITLLREKLSPFIVYGPKSGSSRLVEYWVPVQMSNVQLEQYCSSLLTNSAALCSKNDPIGLLREILISTRKCCDHPYVVEGKLQGRLIEGCALAKILDIGVEASGKLYFLDTILTKMKDQGQKVVILFKTLGGSGRDPLGDILEDYVNQRFGVDSYERVDGGEVRSRRQASVTKFNKDGRFIFLLETRACSPCIKLSSVDAVIIFGSDWNPLNDLKALQKIKIVSKMEINVFRLYTLCTIEEKVLLLSKKNVFLESTVQGISFSTSHMLLTWGASYLLKKLDEFHDCVGSPEILPRDSTLKDVVQEFMSLQKHGTHTSTKFISSARPNDGGYSTDISLLGEQYSHLRDEDQYRFFWAKLLEGRQPRWRYLSLSSQRNRKRVQYYEGTSDANVQTDETIKRQKKTGHTGVQPCSPRVGADVEKEPVSGLFAISPKTRPELSPNPGCGTASARKIHAAISSDKLRDEQKNLHQILKPDMEKLFQILRLKEDVQQMAERFLMYMITNHRVIREPDQLQAFQISVCWIAASILSEKLDHVESLSLAREHLNFNCKTDEAEFAFSKMQFSMKMFLRSEGVKIQSSSKDLVPGTEGLLSETTYGVVRESTVSMKQNEKVAEGMLVLEGFDKQAEKRSSKYIKKIKKCVRKLLDRQSNEEVELQKQWQERKAKLEKIFKLESAVIHSINSSEAVRIDKFKILEANHRQKLDELDSEMYKQLKGMKERHQVEIEQEEKEGIRKMKEWAENGLFDNLQSMEALKSCSLSGNDIEEENANVHRSTNVQVPLLRTSEPHIDAAENSGSAEVAAAPVYKDGAISKSPKAIQINDEVTTFENVGERTADTLGVHASSAVAADEVEQFATSKNDQPSAENHTFEREAEDANEEGASVSERDTAVRTEQHDEASSSTHVEPINSPSTMNPSVVDSLPVSQVQEDAIARARLNNEDVHGETCGMQNEMIDDIMPSSDHCDGNASDHAVYSGEPAAPLVTGVSRPDALTQVMTESIHPPEPPPIHADQRPPHPSLDAAFNPSTLHSSSQFDCYMGSRSLPSSSVPASYVSQEFDPLQREYERICGESNQISKNHEDTVLRLKSDCDKEIEEIVGQIRRKYESMVQEAEVSFLQTKRELDRNQWKVCMNIKLAEAFRLKCIDRRAAQQEAASSFAQQQLLDGHQFSRRRLVPTAAAAAAAAAPAAAAAAAPPPPPASSAGMGQYRQVPSSRLQQPLTCTASTELLLTGQSGAARSAALPLPPLPELARNFEAWNLTEFEASLDHVRRQQQQGQGVVCLSDDE